MTTYTGTDGMTYDISGSVLTVSGSGYINAVYSDKIRTSGGDITLPSLTRIIIQSGVTGYTPYAGKAFTQSSCSALEYIEIPNDFRFNGNYFMGGSSSAHIGASNLEIHIGDRCTAYQYSFVYVDAAAVYIGNYFTNAQMGFDDLKTDLLQIGDNYTCTSSYGFDDCDIKEVIIGENATISGYIIYTCSAHLERLQVAWSSWTAVAKNMPSSINGFVQSGGYEITITGQPTGATISQTIASRMRTPTASNQLTVNIPDASSVQPISAAIFGTAYSYITINVPSALLSSYRSASYWSNYTFAEYIQTASVTHTGTDYTYTGASRWDGQSAYTDTLTPATHRIITSVTVTDTASLVTPGSYTYANNILTIDTSVYQAGNTYTVTVTTGDAPYTTVVYIQSHCTCTGAATWYQGEAYNATIAADTGYEVTSACISVTSAGSSLSFTYSDGTLTLTQFSLSPITVTVTAAALPVYTITPTMTNITFSGDLTYNSWSIDDYPFSLTPAAEHELSTLTVTIASVPYTDYTHIGTAYTIPKEDMTGNVTITAVGVRPPRIRFKQDIRVDGNISSDNLTTMLNRIIALESR